MTDRLHPADVQAIARAVAELIVDNSPRSRLVDAADLADLLGVTRSFIYEHADDLGAVRLGDGTRARLRFDVDAARAALAREHPSEPRTPAAQRTTARPRRPATGHVLQPRRAA